MPAEDAPRSANGWARLSPEERTLKASIAAKARPGGPERTEAARRAWRQRFYDRTDPALSDPEREAETDRLIELHMDRMRLASMTSARHAREAAAAARQAAAQLAEAEQEATG